MCYYFARCCKSSAHLRLSFLKQTIKITQVSTSANTRPGAFLLSVFMPMVARSHCLGLDNTVQRPAHCSSARNKHVASAPAIISPALWPFENFKSIEMFYGSLIGIGKWHQS